MHNIFTKLLQYTKQVLSSFKKVLIWRANNPVNFIKFMIIWVGLTFTIRFFLLKHFAAIPPIFIKLFTWAMFSAMVSIILFYIKYYYKDKIILFLSKFKYFSEFKSKSEKYAHIQEMAEQQHPHLKFWVPYLIIPLTLLPSAVFSFPVEVQTSFHILSVLLLVWYLYYMNKLKTALAGTNVLDEDLPKISNFTAKRWYYSYMVRAHVKKFVRDGGEPIIDSFEKFASVESYKSAVKKGALALKITGVIGAAFCSALTAEHLIYTGSTFTPPSLRLFSKVATGCFTRHSVVQQNFNLIAHLIPKDKIITFCKPGTNELDGEVVEKAVLEYKAWQSDYISTRRPIPELIGPYRIKEVEIVNELIGPIVPSVSDKRPLSEVENFFNFD